MVLALESALAEQPGTGSTAAAEQTETRSRTESAQAEPNLPPPILEPSSQSAVLAAKYRDDASLVGTYVGAASEVWQRAWGGELQWRRWWWSEFALALAVGVEQWAVDSKTLLINPSNVIHPYVDGSALVVPVGVSLVWRPTQLATDWAWAIEVGLRYAWISSDATVAFEYIDHWGHLAKDEHEVPFDSRLIGIGRLELSRKFDRTSDWSWVLAAGYRLDFSEGEKNWLDMDIGNDFGGWTVGFGVRKEFKLEAVGK